MLGRAAEKRTCKVESGNTCSSLLRRCSPAVRISEYLPSLKCVACIHFGCSTGLMPGNTSKTAVSSRRKLLAGPESFKTDFPSSEWQKSQHRRAVENLTLNWLTSTPQYGAPSCTSACDVVADGALSFSFPTADPAFQSLFPTGHTPCKSAFSVCICRPKKLISPWRSHNEAS